MKNGERRTTRATDAAIAIALVAAALLFWKLRIIDPAQAGSFEPTTWQGDLFTYTYPMTVAASRAIGSGEIPIWNPFQASGHPLLAAVAGGILYPLGFSHLLLPAHLAMEATIALHLALAAVFTYLFGRALSLRPLGALAAAIAFAFSGFVSTQAMWFVPSLAACVWLPLGLLAIERILERGRIAWTVVLGVAVAMPILAGWLQTWVYSMYAMALYAGLRLVARVWRRAPLAEVGTASLLLLGGALLGPALAAVQLLPSYELRSLSRIAGGLSPAEILSYGVVPPARFLSHAVKPTPGFSLSSYLGLVPLLAIPLSLFAPFLRLRVLCFWCLVALGLGVTLTLDTAAFMHLPTGSWFRVPQRILFLYAFAGSMLTGITIHWIGSMEGRRRRGWRPWVVAGLVIGLAALFSFASPIAGLERALLWLAAAALCGAVLFSSSKLRRAALAGLVGLLAWDAFHATENAFKHPYHVPEVLDEGREAFDYVKANQGFYRTYLRGEMLDFKLMPKRGILDEIYSVSDYEPLSLERRGRFFRLLSDREGDGRDSSDFMGFVRAGASSRAFRLMDLMSVRFAVLPADDGRFRGALRRRPVPWREVFSHPTAGIAVYRNPAPLPRAYVAAHALPAASGADALDLIARSSFDPRRSVVVEGLDALPQHFRFADAPPIVPARIESYGGSEVAIEAGAPRDGYLVLTDTFYPGWKVTVDGRPAPIYRANYLFRAVPLQEGHHLVKFTYQPRSFQMGAAVSATTLCAMMVAVWLGLLGGWRRRRGPSVP